MSDYMPTTQEIQDAVIAAKATPGDQAHSETWWKLAFHRWYEAEIQASKADALRDEAESVRDAARSNVRKYETWNLTPTETEVRKRLAESQYGIADMLTHRAYKIEKGTHQ